MLRASFQLLALLLVSELATAQQEPGFTSQANLVPVPTLVRDENGSAVYGLHEKDFIIEDDGVGFDASNARVGEGLGLIGMRERAALVGGRVQVRSGLGLGTEVRVTVPDSRATT